MSERCGGQSAADQAARRVEAAVASIHSCWRPVEVDELLFEDDDPVLERMVAEALQNPRVRLHTKLI